ncbi:MAG: hypothetical protein OXD50_08075, partial [Chloroflexi bacterium]|nr:hypothetical protein [Chloroflexota bacterium]
ARRQQRLDPRILLVAQRRLIGHLVTWTAPPSASHSGTSTPQCEQALVLEGKNSPPAGIADKAYFDRLRDFLRQDNWQRHSQFPVPDSIEDPLRGSPAISDDQLGDGDG